MIHYWQDLYGLDHHDGHNKEFKEKQNSITGSSFVCAIFYWENPDIRPLKGYLLVSPGWVLHRIPYSYSEEKLKELKQKNPETEIYLVHSAFLWSVPPLKSKSKDYSSIPLQSLKRIWAESVRVF